MAFARSASDNADARSGCPAVALAVGFMGKGRQVTRRAVRQEVGIAGGLAVASMRLRERTPGIENYRVVRDFVQ